MLERELRQLSFIPRWVITRNIRQQTVAEHSFYVAVYAGQIARWLGYEGDMGELYHAALWHDAEECFTGDIPGPAKRSLIKGNEDTANGWIRTGLENRFPGELRPITEEQRKILKIANLLDETFYQLTEMQLGNQAAVRPYNLSLERLKSTVYSLPLVFPDAMWEEIGRALTEHMWGFDQLPENNDDLAPRS